MVPTDPRWAVQAGESPKYLSNYQNLAKELQICIVPGTVIERHATPNQQDIFYNTAYFISNDGTILGFYRKKNIWHPERPHLTSSGPEHHVAIDTPIGRVGMLICWDLAFPEAFRELIADGAQIVIAPTYCMFYSAWSFTRMVSSNCMHPGTPHDASPEIKAYNPDCEGLFLESTITSRCFENTCAVVFANAAGPSEDFLGLSQITLPVVGPIAKMGTEEGFMVADLDMAVIEAAERNYRVRQDLKKEDWHYVYRHTQRS
jgi:predicted amidohydrolase